MVTIFDLQKGQKVWGGLKPQGQGFASGCAMATEFEISKLAYSMWFSQYNTQFYLLPIRLTYGSDMVINMYDLLDNKIYLTKEDFLNDRNPIDSENDNLETLLSILGVQCPYRNPEIWIWNKDTQEAELAESFFHVFDIFDLKLPDGFYATKEECNKANKQSVTVKVVREFHTEVDEDEAKYLLENPDEYVWKEGDECISSSDLL